MKRILITGASGFLGSRVSQYLKARYQILAPGRDRMDFTDLESVRRFFDREKPEIVVHCGAVSDTGICREQPEFTYRVNVLGTENLAKACAGYQSKLVFCSSDQIYAGSSGMNPHKESEQMHPSHPYGRQKLEAEELCFTHCSNAVALRLSWMYDVRQMNPSEHGDFWRNLMKNLQEGKKMAYPIHDHRGITYVKYILESMERIFELSGGIYNMGSENDKNMYETIRMFFRAAGMDERLICRNEEAFAEEPRNIRMDMGKARECGILVPDTMAGLLEGMVDQADFEKVGKL